ncbi:MAG: peptide ABC transporter ATP-binding protein [Pelagibacteraceae bacterium TMED237]|nr:peptide ABC transporter ATP-binding protein [Candidatus Neomarinimicrobiota bacterium]OUW95589.1 MAG: peptide ABC transporter ATP-binding protein [Pelagibacteraceae bacterium TMED237]|tara:strand:- start:2570 stop:3553 length:984 start_codon:yes stop_codon:yes gene_type:complete
MSKKLIEVKNLKTFFYTEAGTAKAVNNISFDIYQGEVLGIVGESGSGKSVTSLSINRLIPNPPGEIVDGEVLYKGTNLLNLTYDEMREYRGRDISMIFQEPMTSLNPVLRIETQMNEVLVKHEGLTNEEATIKSIEMLKAVGIPEPERRIRDYPHQFSGGMRQRIMIAMALQCNPSLLIADEPTTALDVTIQAQILDLMMELKDKRKDAAILLITHDLAVVAETCDRVIVMYGGVIQEIAPIEKLFKNPIHPYTKALMESIPKMDIKSKRLKALKGMVPSILELGDECKLCSRFDPKDCACKGTKIEPELIEISKDHFARINKDMLK